MNKRMATWPLRLALALALLIGALAGPAAASRAVRADPGDDLPALVADIPDDMLVILAPGTYRVSLVLSGRRLIFIAPEGGVVFEPGEQGFAFLLRDGAEIALDNIEVRTGRADPPPVIVQGGTLNLKEATIVSSAGMALYVDGALEAEGGRIEGRGDAAVLVTGGDKAELRGTEVVNPDGIGLAVQDSESLLIEDGRLDGRTAVQVSGLSGEMRLTRSLLRGQGADAMALALQQVRDLEVIDSALIGSAAALNGTIGNGDAWQIDASLLAAERDVIGVAGTAEADLRLETSLVLSTGADGYGFLADGESFVPLLGDSLLLARGGSAFVAQNGAGGWWRARFWPVPRGRRQAWSGMTRSC